VRDTRVEEENDMKRPCSLMYDRGKYFYISRHGDATGTKCKSEKWM
jgi:hypothetical protein